MLAAPSLGLAALGLPLAVQLPDFYANTMRMPVVMVGVVFMLVRLVDIALDPFIGQWIDKTRTGFGRFRPWLLFSMLPVLAGVGLVFFNTPGPLALEKLVLGLILIYFGFSAGVIAQTGWMATKPANWRPKLFGLWQGGNILGILIILTIPAVAQYIGMGREGAVWYMGMGLCVLIPLSALPTIFMLRDGAERYDLDPNLPEFKTKPAHFLTLLKRGDVMRLMGVDLTIGFAAGCLGALFQIQFSDRLGFETLAAGMLLFYFLCGLAGLPIWTWCAGKFGENRTLLLSLVLTIAGLLLVPFIPAKNAMIAFIVLGVSGLAYAAPSFLIRSEAARIAQDIKATRDEDTEASMLALATMTAKLGYAIAVGVAFVSLEAIDFAPKTLFHRHTEETLAGIGILFVGLPLIGHGLAVLILLLGGGLRKPKDA